MRLLVTGASGFVGGALVARMAADGDHQVVAVSRRRPAQLPNGVAWLPSPDLAADADWRLPAGGANVVIHAAARVHVMHDSAGDPLAEYRSANVEGTLALARQAVEAGARRFVFVSSIKVNGERTSIDVPFTADSPPAPVDPYGVSKYEAECALRELGSVTGLDVVIVRPVLVYGPGVKANFATMVRCLQKGLPLPLGAIRNARSFLAIDNLVDLLVTVARHPAAANQTFLVSDGEDLSTPDLLRRCAAALGTRAHLIPVPAGVLEWTGRVLGRSAMVERLTGSLRVDIQKTRQRLGWTPPMSVDAALRQMARHFSEAHPHS